MLSEFLTDTFFIYALVIGSIIAIMTIWFRKKKGNVR